MQLYLQHVNLRSSNALDAWVEDQVLALGQTRQIDEANVRLSRLRDASPAYQVKVHLVTPGVDLVAESRDHTLQAAVNKVMRQIREQIEHRARKPRQRLKNKRSLPAARSRGGRVS